MNSMLTKYKELKAMNTKDIGCNCEGCRERYFAEDLITQKAKIQQLVEDAKYMKELLAIIRKESDLQTIYEILWEENFQLDEILKDG